MVTTALLLVPLRCRLRLVLPVADPASLTPSPIIGRSMSTVSVKARKKRQDRTTASAVLPDSQEPARRFIPLRHLPVRQNQVRLRFTRHRRVVLSVRLRFR